MKRRAYEALRAWGLGLALVPLGGCQFFFPLPLDPEIEPNLPSTQAVRTIGKPFQEGEHLEAEVFASDVAVGKASLRVGKKCLADGKLALPLTGSGSMGGLLSFVSSGSADTRALINLDDNMPLESIWDVEADEKRAFTEADYAPGVYRVHTLREIPGKPDSNSYRRVALPTEQVPHDGHSLLGYLRRWDPPEGTRGYVYAIMSRYLIRADVVLTGRETIKTALGERETIRIDGVATRINDKTLRPQGASAPKPFTFWLTADDDRVPVRITVETEMAPITIELTKYEKGAVSAGDPKPCEGRADKKALGRARGPKPPRDRKPGDPPPPRPPDPNKLRLHFPKGPRPAKPGGSAPTAPPAPSAVPAGG